MAITDTTMFAAVVSRFPELIEDLTHFGWLWVKASVLVLEIKTDGQLAEFVAGLAECYRALPEIIVHKDRLFFALAAERCELAMINKALVVARDTCGAPGSFTRWKKCGSLPGEWQCWSYSQQHLSHPVCLTSGQLPDQALLIEYVQQVEEQYQQLFDRAGGSDD